MKEIEFKAYTKYKNMFQMKNTAVYMVLRGRRDVEWVGGGVSDQSTLQTPVIRMYIAFVFAYFHTYFITFQRTCLYLTSI
jgi:hypothetical protein